MQYRKRCLFSSRRAQEGTHIGTFYLIELVAFALFIYLMFSYCKNIASNSAFERNYLAKDLSQTINALYASPNEIKYVYQYNTSKFTLGFRENRVRLGEAETTNPDDERRYGYADEADRRFSQTEKLVKPGEISFFTSPSFVLYVLSDTHPFPSPESISTPPTLYLMSTPEGAEVSFGLGKSPLGNTPFGRDTQAGQYTLIFRTQEGECSLDIQIEEGKTYQISVNIKRGSTLDDTCELSG